jgi:hypothetical protein
VSGRDGRQSVEDIEHKPARHQPNGIAAFSYRFRRVILFAAFCGVIYVVFSLTKRGDAARLTWQKEQKWHESWYVSFLYSVLLKS